MKYNELIIRTKGYSLNVVRFVRTLKIPRDEYFLKNQIMRSATSIACNYRAVCRAQTNKAFISKMSIVIEETDETLFWMEVIQEIYPGHDQPESILLIKEGNELLKIFVSSRLTMLRKMNHTK